jgi:hypothetical protein
VSTCRKAGGEDPGGLGVQELPPGRTRAARRRIDARGVQDLPDGGQCDRHAELRQLAVDAAVSPERILLCQADDKAGDARAGRRAAGRAPLPRVVFARSQPAVPGQQRRWRNREDAGPAAAGYEACQRGEPHPVGRAVPDPAGVPAQRRVLVAEYEQPGIIRQVAAGYQDSEAEYPAN